MGSIRENYRSITSCNERIAKGEWEETDSRIGNEWPISEELAFDMFNDKIAVYERKEEVTIISTLMPVNGKGKWFNSVTAWEDWEGGTVSQPTQRPQQSAPITQQDTTELPFWL